MKKQRGLVTRRNPRRESAGRNADATRLRFLEAAKIRFSQGSYDGVSVRDIAADAGADPALLNRYFGSKEGLFREVAAHAFGTDDVLHGGAAMMVESMVSLLMKDVGVAEWRTGYDPFRLLLCSIGGTTAGPIVAGFFTNRFVTPIAEALDGDAPRERAIMLVSQMLGFALVHVALASPNASDLDRVKLEELLRNAFNTALLRRT